VTLRWVFSKTFFHQLQQLKKIFDLADSDRSGVVSREELIAIFVDQTNNTMADLMKMIRKVLIKRGVNPDHVSVLCSIALLVGFFDSYS
jgi:Ca2+-binding EF-hand superfamily protein